MGLWGFGYFRYENGDSLSFGFFFNLMERVPEGMKVKIEDWYWRGLEGRLDGFDLFYEKLTEKILIWVVFWVWMGLRIFRILGVG